MSNAKQHHFWKHAMHATLWAAVGALAMHGVHKLHNGHHTKEISSATGSVKQSGLLAMEWDPSSALLASWNGRNYQNECDWVRGDGSLRSLECSAEVTGSCWNWKAQSGWTKTKNWCDEGLSWMTCA